MQQSAAPVIVVGGGQSESTPTQIGKWVAIGVVGIILIGVGYYIYTRYFQKPALPIGSTNEAQIAKNKEYSSELQTKEEATGTQIETTGTDIQQAEGILAADFIVYGDDKKQIAQALTDAEIANKLAEKENLEDIVKGKMILYNAIFDNYVYYRANQPPNIVYNIIKAKYWGYCDTQRIIMDNYEKEILDFCANTLDPYYATLDLEMIIYKSLDRTRTPLSTYISLNRDENSPDPKINGRWNACPTKTSITATQNDQIIVASSTYSST